MKIIYCIRATYNPGGMERVLLNKVTYLVNKLHWDVTIVTTDQQGRPPFYPFPEQIRMIDLHIDYADDNGKARVWQDHGVSSEKAEASEGTCNITNEREGGRRGVALSFGIFFHSVHSRRQ